MGLIIGGSLKPGTVIGTDISLLAAIPAECMTHTFVNKSTFGLGYSGTPVNTTEINYVFTGAGFVKGYHALCVNTGSSSSMTFDLKKNGTSILSSVITITNLTPSNTKQDGVLTGVVACAAGDILTVVLTVSSSTGSQGPMCWSCVQETVSPV